MSTDEDVLLREVEEDLQHDRQIEFLKKYAPWLGGVAAVAVVGVGVFQVVQNTQMNARAESAIAFQDALTDSEEVAPNVGADTMLQLADQVDGGYAALSELRAAGLFQSAGDKEKALTTYARVYGNTSLPTRFTDLARIRAATIELDENPDRAREIVDAIETSAFAPYASEIKGLVALKTGQFDEAYSIFSSLKDGLDTPGALAGRASVLLPVADAGRSGVPLEAQVTEAESFIESFTEQLQAEGLVPGGAVETAPQDGTETDAVEEGVETPSE